MTPRHLYRGLRRQDLHGNESSSARRLVTVIDICWHAQAADNGSSRLVCFDLGLDPEIRSGSDTVTLCRVPLASVNSTLETLSCDIYI